MGWAAIVGFRLVTPDLARAAAFYAALGFAADPPAAIGRDDAALLGVAGGRRQRLRRGAAMVDLESYNEPGRPYPRTPAGGIATSFQHLAIPTDDIAAAWGAARAAGAVPIGDAAPVALPAASGGVTGIKFRDPDGHPLELIAFPSGNDAAVRRGIDHSAIVVADLAASLAFYASAGLVEGRRGLNVGGEQARLDGLADPVVDVVPLVPPAGAAHVELLHYRRPAAITAPPPAITDIAATRIVWRADRDAIVRDPDNHLHELRR